MPRVSFTPHLLRHVDAAPGEFVGGTVREVLDAVFTKHPGIKSYVVDEQGALRKHVNIFIDGAPIKDRELQSDAPGEEVYIMQALSGG
jgi:molybdopterin synthase sulfur carrier subunit